MSVLRLSFASRELWLRATASRDQAGGALCSANVLRPAGSPLIWQNPKSTLRRARHRPDPSNVTGIRPLHSHSARCLVAWGEWRSEIKEEAAGRGTFAEPLTPSAEAYKQQGIVNSETRKRPNDETP